MPSSNKVRKVTSENYPTDAETEGDQLPFTASYITPYPELNVEEADLFYQEGTPEVPFQTNQEWYATFTGEDGSRYAVTLEDEDTLALKVYLDGNESDLSLVNTVYFARQEAMGWPPPTHTGRNAP